VLVVGTGTEVGKTWVSARLLTALRAAGATVAARKPAQSFDADDDAASLDAAILGAASGEDPTVVCPRHRWYEVAMAPPMAAEALGRDTFSIADLAGELGWPAGGVDVGLVESAGGVRSPQASDGDAVTLCDALTPDVVVLVADAGLGTINAVRLTVGVLGRNVTVVLNRYDERNELHVRNRQWLVERDGVDVVVMPGGEPALVTLIRGE
jgi:dethiobiotin synthetase